MEKVKVSNIIGHTIFIWHSHKYQLLVATKPRFHIVIAVVVYTDVLVEPSKVQSYKSVLKCIYFKNFH
jgi:hypothetical protein